MRFREMALIMTETVTWMMCMAGIFLMETMNSVKAVRIIMEPMRREPLPAAPRNGGIAGITDNKYVKVMVLKALGTQYGVGEEKAIIEAIRYAEANGASICNLSFGTTEYYPELEKVMRASRMLFVVSAGNGNEKGIGEDTDQKPDYPSSFDLDNVISVANLMFDGSLAESSNYGAKSVDIAAPGTYIVSTIADGGYGFMTGTSMSAPMVAGSGGVFVFLSHGSAAF